MTLLFSATAPLIVFYAIGYRFNTERGIFVYSGSVTIKPSPLRVDVYIDEENISGKRVNLLNYSYHIGGIKPGEHFIEVKSSG